MNILHRDFSVWWVADRRVGGLILSDSFSTPEEVKRAYVTLKSQYPDAVICGSGGGNL